MSSTCSPGREKRPPGAGDRRLLADALGLLSRANWLGGRYDQAMQAATAALETLSGLEESPQLARATARLSLPLQCVNAY